MWFLPTFLTFEMIESFGKQKNVRNDNFFISKPCVSKKCVSQRANKIHRNNGFVLNKHGYSAFKS